MPELPEAEVTRQGLLKANILNICIKEVFVTWPKTVGGNIKNFSLELIGKKILSISRKGKLLIFHLDSEKFLTTHLRMSGRFNLAEGTVNLKKHDRVAVWLESGLCLYFHDPRKFGRMLISKDLKADTAKLGVDPLKALNRGLAALAEKMVKAADNFRSFDLYYSKQKPSIHLAVVLEVKKNQDLLAT